MQIPRRLAPRNDSAIGFASRSLNCSFACAAICGRRSGLRDGAAEENGAILADQIFLRGGLHFGGSDGEKLFKNSVDAIGIFVEERETGESVHEAEARDGTFAGFEHGVKIGAQLDFN